MKFGKIGILLRTFAVVLKKQCKNNDDHFYELTEIRGTLF